MTRASTNASRKISGSVTMLSFVSTEFLAADIHRTRVGGPGAGGGALADDIAVYPELQAVRRVRERHGNM